METLDQITSCICDDLKDFEKEFFETIGREDESLGEMLRYVLSLKGKRIRPILTFLSAACYGKITAQTKRAAIIVELLHTASLLHDDVIDQSPQRRGRKTLNFLWDNKSAILVGDYIFGKALYLISSREDFNLLPIYSNLAMYLPKGELKEEQAIKQKDSSIEYYMSIIHDKTASLIEASLMLGRCSCGATQSSESDTMKELGRCLGMVFQIKDDVLDFCDNTGKPKGTDIREQKVTLPVIYYMQTLAEQEKQDLLSFIYSDNKSREDIAGLIEKIEQSEALTKTYRKMDSYIKQAFEIIDSMPSNVYSQSLSLLVQYLIKRNK